MKPTMFAFALVALAGCGDVQYAMDTYDKVPKQTVMSYGIEWSIFDKPDAQKMGVVTSTEQAALEGASWGLAKMPAGRYVDAAQAYLDQTGRNCRAVGSSPLLTSFEVTYICG